MRRPCFDVWRQACTTGGSQSATSSRVELHHLLLPNAAFPPACGVPQWEAILHLAVLASPRQTNLELLVAEVCEPWRFLSPHSVLSSKPSIKVD